MRFGAAPLSGLARTGGGRVNVDEEEGFVAAGVGCSEIAAGGRAAGQPVTRWGLMYWWGYVWNGLQR